MRGGFDEREKKEKRKAYFMEVAMAKMKEANFEKSHSDCQASLSSDLFPIIILSTDASLLSIIISKSL